MDRLPAGVATGIGSMPGSDPRESASMIVGELSFPHVAELPGRGVGSDMIGRMAAVLVDMPIDVVADGYRLAGGPTRLMQRAKGFLSSDLDALEEAADRGGLLGGSQPCKIQLCGPFTLAATLQMRGGHKLVHDRGAWSALVDSAAEGISLLVAALERRLGCTAIVQLDEPLIERVIAGQIAPLTRLDVNEPIPVQVVTERYAALAEMVGRPLVLHFCGRRVPWQLLSPNIFAGLSLDWSLLVESDWDQLGGYLDTGGVVFAGAVATVRPAGELPIEHVMRPLVETFDRIGLPRKMLAEQLIVTPTCGLAGADPDWALGALRLCSQAASALADDPSAL